MIVENVRGAQKWVGRARWSFGSFYLWGDVPALMPPTISAQKFNPDGTAHGQGSWFAVADSKDRGRKQRGSGAAWWDKALDERRKEATAIKNGIKQPGIDLSEVGFNVANARQFQHMVEGVKIKRSADDKRQHIGTSRKFASAMIAKIPLPLSRHIGATFRVRAFKNNGTIGQCGGPTIIGPNRPYCKDDQSCCDFCCGN